MLLLHILRMSQVHIGLGPLEWLRRWRISFRRMAVSSTVALYEFRYVRSIEGAVLVSE